MAHSMGTQPNTLNATTLKPFVDALPVPPIAKPLGTRPLPASPKVNLPYYRLAAQAKEMKVHRDLKPAHFWSYGGSVPGPTF